LLIYFYIYILYFTIYMFLITLFFCFLFLRGPNLPTNLFFPELNSPIIYFLAGLNLTVKGNFGSDLPTPRLKSNRISYQYRCFNFFFLSFKQNVYKYYWCVLLLYSYVLFIYFMLAILIFKIRNLRYAPGMVIKCSFMRGP
jgi:hypothetical protein